LTFDPRGSREDEAVRVVIAVELLCTSLFATCTGLLDFNQLSRQSKILVRCVFRCKRAYSIVSSQTAQTVLSRSGLGSQAAHIADDEFARVN
jgi:hypothetical protein